MYAQIRFSQSAIHLTESPNDPDPVGIEYALFELGSPPANPVAADAADLKYDRAVLRSRPAPKPDTGRIRRPFAALCALALAVLLSVGTGARAAPPDARGDDLALKVGDAKTVRFRLDPADRAARTPRQLADQCRDWLLIAAVRSLALDADTLNRALHDVPAYRHAATRATAQYEYGATRWVPVGRTRAVALVPALPGPPPKSAPGAPTPAEERVDQLGTIADEFRQTAGAKPAEIELLVFEYALDTDRLNGRLTRRDAVTGADLFGEKYGYTEAVIGDKKALQKFLDGGRDLTFAAHAGGKLTVGGRKTAVSQLGLTTDDVAVLWQSERDFGATGFSLDPAYDFDGLKKWFDESGRAMLRLAARVERGGPITDAVIKDVEAGFARGDAIPALKALKRLKDEIDRLVRRGDDLERAAVYDQFARWLNQDIERLRYQAARYDGGLVGTELGMTLFYTDLLAKLWVSVNLADSMPRHIPDFRADPDGGLSAAFKQATLAHPGTRVWFGPDKRGYQFTGADRSGVLFRPLATRIYAKSSDPTAPRDEVPPGPTAEATYGWWNDHYAEVARHEPQYQRLNQYMKWSLLTIWLGTTDREAALGFLADEEPRRNLWFPDWAAANKALKFRDWEKVGFHPKGWNGVKTEAMPILFSKSFASYGEPEKKWTVSGGVDGGKPGLITGRKPLADPAAGGLVPFRGLDPGAGGRDRVVTLPGNSYTFPRPIKPNEMKLEAVPPPDTAFRGPDGELRVADLSRYLEQRKSELDIRLDVGTRTGTQKTDRALGRLRMRGDGDTIDVAFQGSEAVKLDALAQRVSAGETFAGTPDVAAHFIATDGAHLVKFHGSDRWYRLAVESEPTAALPTGALGRVVAPPTDAPGRLFASLPGRSVVYAPVEADAVSAAVARAKYVIVSLPPNGGTPRAFLSSLAPPERPPGAIEVTLDGPGGAGWALKGWARAEARDGLPDALFVPLTEGGFGKDGYKQFLEAIKTDAAAMGRRLEEAPLSELLKDARAKGNKAFTHKARDGLPADPRARDEADVARARAFLDAGQPSAALPLLDALGAKFGNAGVLRARAELLSGQAELAGELVAKLPRLDAKTAREFYTDVDRILGTPTLPAVVRADTERFARFVNLKQQLDPAKADVVLSADAGRPELVLVPLGRPKAVANPDFEALAGAAVFVQADLVKPGATVAQLLKQKDVELVALYELPGVARLRPDAVVLPKAKGDCAADVPEGLRFVPVDPRDTRVLPRKFTQYDATGDKAAASNGTLYLIRTKQ